MLRADALRPFVTCMALVLGVLIGAGGARTGLAAPAVALPHYDLAVQLDQDAASLSTREVVRFTNLTGTPLDSMVFKTPIGAVTQLVLSAAVADGQPASATFDASGSVLELSLPTRLDVGSTSSVELDWSARVPGAPGRLSSAEDVISLGNWFPTLAVHHGEWDRRPYSTIGDPFFTEVADFDLHLSLARAATVAFTGDLVSQEGTAWEISARSVRDLAVAISPDYQQLSAQVPGGPQVSVYALDVNRAQTELEAARTFVSAYAALVGPYPLATLRVAETGLQPAFAGMEYPGLVFISATAAGRSAPATVRGIVAHEVAHQWFYALMGDDQLADPWLDEAFATYLPDEVSETLAPNLSGAAGNMLAPTQDGVPIDRGIFDFPDNGSYSTAVYARGGRFLAELRQTMGDSSWTAFLRSLYATYANKVETPRAVLDMAQRSAPTINLDALFKEYTDFYAGAPDSAAADWSVHVPDGAWSGAVRVEVNAAFLLESVDLWLDDWPIAHGSAAGSYSVDVSAIPAGEYVLLTHVAAAGGTTFEHAVRVTITP